MLDDLNRNYPEGGSGTRKEFCTRSQNRRSEQDLTLCMTDRRFGETCCLHLQNDGFQTWHTGMHRGVTKISLKMEAACPSTRCPNRENCHLIASAKDRKRIHRGSDKSLARLGRKQARNPVRDELEFNIEMRAVIKFFPYKAKVPKEIHAILTETLACFLSGRAKDLSAPLYVPKWQWCFNTTVI